MTNPIDWRQLCAEMTDPGFEGVGYDLEDDERFYRQQERQRLRGILTEQARIARGEQ